MKKVIFLILSIFIVIFVVVLFFVLQGLSNNAAIPPQATIPIPTKIPVLTNPRNTNAVPYDANKSKQFVSIMKQKPQLSSAGQAAKDKLISSLHGNPGTIYTSPNVSIDYLPALDLFQAEILIPDITLSKNDAVSRLVSLGFTNQDTCNLPLNFYMSADVSQQIKNTNTIFNPLPDGC